MNKKEKKKEFFHTYIWVKKYARWEFSNNNSNFMYSQVKANNYIIKM